MNEEDIQKKIDQLKNKHQLIYENKYNEETFMKKIRDQLRMILFFHEIFKKFRKFKYKHIPLTYIFEKQNFYGKIYFYELIRYMEKCLPYISSKIRKRKKYLFVDLDGNHFFNLIKEIEEIIIIEIK